MSLVSQPPNDVLELLDIELARALGRMSHTDDPAVELAIALTLRNVRRGHTCLPLEADLTALGIAPDPGFPALPEARRWRDALRESALADGGPLVLDPALRLYLRRYYDFERDIAHELAARTAICDVDATPSQASAQALDRLFSNDDDPGPREAAARALRHSVSILCGGPGTGKTTTVAAVVALLVERRLADGGPAPKVALVAPTGKAAVRLGDAVVRAKDRLVVEPEVLDAIPNEAVTLHRALGMSRRGMKFRRGRDFPLDADIIVVDEASMVDLGLMRQLLIAAPPEATLLIVGDPDQLTSVEAGSVLKDLVRANDETWWCDRVTRLTKTYRYDSSTALGQLVAAVRDGDLPAVEASFAEGGDRVRAMTLDHLDEAIDEAAGRWHDILRAHDAEEHFRRREGFVVLSPFRKGRFGTNQLGDAIAARLERNDLTVRPIIIEENHHELGVYNGDLGMAFERDGLAMATIQQEPGKRQELAAVRLPSHGQAFALSVHKAQGSEFDDVLIVLPEEDTPLLTRELLYTAVSRARRSVQVVGPTPVVAGTLARRARRFSGLVDRISELAP